MSKNRSFKLFVLILTFLFEGSGVLYSAKQQITHDPFSSLIPVVQKAEDSSQKKQILLQKQSVLASAAKQKESSASALEQATQQTTPSPKKASLNTSALELIGTAQWSEHKLALIQKKQQRYWVEQGHSFEDFLVLEILSNSVIFRNTQGEILRINQQ